MANLYEKLQAIRVELQGMQLKKNGRNTFAKYDYYELADFLPQVNQLLAKHKATTVVTFTKEMATLTLIDCEKPGERIEFTSPMASANLKGVHEIQNLGAVETYQRRYLYMAAFEIVESDAVNAVQGSPGQQAAPAETPVNTNPGWCAPVGGEKVFVVDWKNDRLAELERLWQFMNWGDGQALMQYAQQWMGRNNIAQMTPTTYEALLKEQIAYLKQSGVKVEDALPI